MTTASINERSEITLKRLEAALKRLIDGKPERTPLDGKINIKRINDEAGLSSGSIYYYKSFIEKARAVIAGTKSQSTMKNGLKKLNTENLRKQRDEEKRLKIKYRTQRDEIKAFCDQVVRKNANLEFALFEASERIQQLETEIKGIKVIGIPKGRQA